MNTLLKYEDISIVEATEAQDYTKMFDVQCGSCMVIPRHDYFTTRDTALWPIMRDKYGMHPASWYHYTGYSQGIWMEYKGIPVARGMRYRPLEGWNADGTAHYGAWMAFGDVKFENVVAGELLHEIANKELHLPSLSFRTPPVATLNPFVIPALEHEDDFFCPLAHSDNNAKDFAVTFLEHGTDGKSAPVFRFAPLSLGADRKSYLHVTSTYDWRGYISAKLLVKEIAHQQELFNNTYVKDLHRLTGGRKKDYVGHRKVQEAKAETA